jgi:diguanylate cyclase (GGDEF)-like protein
MTELIMKWVEKKSTNLHILLSFICFNLIILTGLIDYHVSSVNLFIFYTFLVVFASLFLSTADGIVSGILSASLNFITNSKYLEYHSPFTLVINYTIDLALFMFIILIVVQLRYAFLREKNLARTDYLTGLKNRRFLMENLSLRNNSFLTEYSIFYIDLDRFYSFIEDYGLARADDMVKKTARFLKQYYKDIYRFEENRFIILMDEKEGQKSALSKMQILKNELQIELTKQNLPTTFSVGIAYVTKPGIKITNIILSLFKLIQSIKKEGGNQVKYIVLK